MLQPQPGSNNNKSSDRLGDHRHNHAIVCLFACTEVLLAFFPVGGPEIL